MIDPSRVLVAVPAILAVPLVLLPAGAGAAAAQESLGYVQHVRGEWVLDGEPPRPITAGFALPAGGTIRPAGERSGADRLVVVLMDGRRIACPDAEHCPDGRLVLDARPQPAVGWTGRIVAAIAGFLRQPPVPLVSLSARGAGAPDEGVLRLDSGVVDLTAVLGGLDPGDYRFCLRPILLATAADAGGSGDARGFRGATEPGGPGTAGCVVEADVGWRADVAPVLRVDRGPGLYALVRRDARAQPESWVLLATDSRYEAARVAFDSARSITAGWGHEAGDEEVRWFLRAYLWTLANPPRIDGAGGAAAAGGCADGWLVPGGACESRLGAGRIDAWRVAVGAGDFAAVEVDQRDVDVVVELFDGEAFEHRTDRYGGGAERLRWIGREGADWSVRVAPVDGDSGAYAIRLLEPRRAGERDRQLVEADRLADRAADHYYAGRPDEAASLHERELPLREAALGPDHPEVATLLNNLAYVYASGGRYAEAEPLYARAVRVREAADGPESTGVASVLENLAQLYRRQGRTADAVPLYERVLRIYEAAYGAADADAAWAALMLAESYAALGRHAEAEPYNQRAVTGLEAALGPDHVDVGTALHSLGNLYFTMGRLGEAEAAYARALRIREAALGPDHVRVAWTLDQLGDVLRARGRYAEAEPVHLRAVRIQEAANGPDHADVASMLNGLAALYSRQARFAEAESTFLRVIRIREAALPSTHADLASALNNLGLLYREMGRYAEAEPLLERAIRVWEAARGPVHPDVAVALNNLGLVQHALARYERAEALFRRSLEIREATLGPDHSQVAESLDNLGLLFHAQARYADAEPLLRRALDIWTAALGPDHPSVGQSLHNLGGFYQDQGRYDEAERFITEALRVREAALGPDHPHVADALSSLASVQVVRGRMAEAEPLLQRALRIRETALGADHASVAALVNELALLYCAQGRCIEAAPLAERALAGLEAAHGPDHPAVAAALLSLSKVDQVRARYAESERLARRALGIMESAHGPDHPDVASVLMNLVTLYYAQGRYAEAEPLSRRALEIVRNARGADHPELATALANVAPFLFSAASYAEAEPLLENVLRIWESAFGSEHPNMIVALINLAALYRSQARFAEAEPLLRRALRIVESSLGGDHPFVATASAHLAVLYITQGRFAEAEPFAVRALEITEAAYGPGHPELAGGLVALSTVRHGQGRMDDAVRLADRAAAIAEAAHGPDHPQVIASLIITAGAYAAESRYAELEPLLDRGFEILGRSSAFDPQLRAVLHAMRAALRHHEGDLEAAHADLEEAIRTVEEMRPNASGSDEVRAAFFGRFTALVDQMVQWRVQAGDVAAAFEYAERGRARALLDQFAAAQLDLRRDIAPEALAPLEAREHAAQAAMARARHRMAVLRPRTDLDVRERLRGLQALQDSLAAAEREFHRVYNEIKQASPLWREIITRDGQPVPLAGVQRRLVPERGLLLLYHSGDEASHVFVLPPAGGSPRAMPLTAGEREAAALGVPAGPLSGRSLRLALMGGAEDADASSPGGAPGDASTHSAPRTPGVLAELTRAPAGRGGPPPELIDRLHALWRVLVPEEVRGAVLAAAELVVIPDAGLHLLPFEALVLESGQDSAAPRFWVDAGPAVRYAPSATALYGMLEAEAARPGAARAGGVLSVSHAIYDPARVAAAQGEGDAARAVAAAGGGRPGERFGERTRSAYALAGGTLEELSHTAYETEAIREALSEGAALGPLQAFQRLAATERNVRAAAAGKRILHFATHGLVDEERSSLFAALAFTPPASAVEAPEDDGFLQLHEVYALDLADAELVVLSACETNVGRVLRGEGVFALSRGFLAAGARRVVASQWAVADESTAELIGHFFRGIARDAASGRPVRFGRALIEARRSLRNDPRWQHPYYWAPFVLAGAP